MLAPRKLTGEFLGLLLDADPIQQVEGLGLDLGTGPSTHQRGGQHEVVQHREVGKQIELLKHHAHLSADGVDLAQVVAQAVAVDADRALLKILQGIEGADEGALAGPGGTHHHHHFAAMDREVHTAEGVITIRIPLFDPAGLNHQVAGARSHGRLADLERVWGSRRFSRARLPRPRAAQQDQNNRARVR